MERLGFCPPAGERLKVESVGIVYKGPTMSAISAEPFQLDAPLSSGGWILYFHPAKENRWHMDTFKKVATVNTFRDLAHVFFAVSPTDWVRGKFFFTPEGIPPLMENARNIRGGSYSIRVDRSIAGEMMQSYMLASVLGKCLVSNGDLVSCVRITPRRDFNILQIWNRDSQKFCVPSGLAVVDPRIPEEEVKYVPHVEKKI